MGVKRWVVPAAVVLAACTGGSDNRGGVAERPPPTQLNAGYLCRRYVPGHLVSSEATTVGELRTTTIGSRGPAQSKSFPKLGNPTAAAWCWTGKPDAYNVYAVASDGEVVKIVTGLGAVEPADAHGAPHIP